MVSIRKPMINEFKIPIPPLPVQEEIVRILDSFTKLNEELNEELTKELINRKKQYEYYRDELLNFDDTVKYMHLCDISNIKRGIRVVKKDLKDTNLFPVYQNSLTPLGNYDKYNYDKDTTFIISAGSAGEIGFSDHRFWAADDCFCIISQKDILNKFLYYYLKKNKNYLLSKVRKASVPRLSKIYIEKIKIPILPFDEQKRIVAILDKLDAFCNDLTIDLPAEIEARKKQYEYYRDKLLTFKELKQ